MKRLIGYLSISAALLTGVLVAVVPSLLSVNGDGDFASSNRFVFKISPRNVSADFSQGTNNGDLMNASNGDTPLEVITDTFKDRLAVAGISSYELESYSDDTFSLTFKDSTQIYDDIISYLTFSNSFMLKNADEEYNLGFSAADVNAGNTTTASDQLFVEGSANVQYRNGYPYVVVQLANPDSFKTMLDGITSSSSDDNSGSDADTGSSSSDTGSSTDTGSDTGSGDTGTSGDSGTSSDSGSTGEVSQAHRFNKSDISKSNTTTGTTGSSDGTGSGESEEAAKVDPKKAIFVVNNWLTGLNLQSLLDNENGNITDSNFSDYVITYFDTTNPSSFIWDYDSSLSSEDQAAQTYEYLYFSNYNLGAINGDGGLDVTTSYQTYNTVESDERLAYKKANLLAGKLNSTSLNYDVTLINSSQLENNSNLVAPFIEYIKRAGIVEFSTVLICTIIATVIVSLFVLLNYGLPGLLGLIVSGANVVGSLYLFNFLGNEFNIGTILGLFAVAAVSILGVTIWLHRGKEDIYLGKNLKKAYQDANKKTLFNLLDFTVIGAIIGLVAYLIPNSYTSSFGGVLLIGVLLSIITIGIVFRAVSWLLYNSQVAQNHIKLFGVERKLVPDLSKAEKPTYFDAFKRRTSKGTFKVCGIIASVLLLASIVGITTFQVMNGNIYNSPSNESTSKVVVSYVLRNANDDFNTDNVEVGIQSGLGDIYFDEAHQEQVFGDSLSVNSFYYEFVSGETSPITNREYYFVVDLGEIIDVENVNQTNYYYFDGSSVSALSLTDAITAAIQANIGENYTVTTSHSYDYNDDLINMYVSIAVAIAVAGIFLYFLLRFGPAKALTSLLIGAAGLVSVVGIASLTRGPFPSEITLGLLLISVVTYLIFDVFFVNERLTFLENKHELKELGAREEAYDYAGNSIYNYIVVNIMFVAFIVLSFFFTAAFDRNTLLFILVGLFIVVIYIKAMQLPIQIAFTKVFEKIGDRFSENRLKAKANKKGKKVSYDDGPQEAIFIDIND